MRRRSDKILLALLAYIVLSVISKNELSGQEFNFQQINYTVEDGLPSNECHRVLQDENGYIWIATDRGLVKFDGYEFRTYGIRDGLMDLSCLSMMFDIEGRLWVRTLSSKFFIYDISTDRLTLYQHQKVIDPYLDQLKVLDFHIDSSMNLTCVVEGIGYLIINAEGKQEEDRGNRNEGKGLYFTKALESHLLVSGINRGPGPDFPPLDIEKYLVGHASHEAFDLIYNHNSSIDFPSHLAENSVLKGLALNESQSILSIRGIGLFYDIDQLLHQRTTAMLDVIQHGGQYISAEIQNKGVKFYYSYSDLIHDRYSYTIPDVSATDIMKDQNGGLWISTLSNGIIYLRNKDIISISPKGAHSNLINQIVQGPNGLCFLENRTRLYKLKSNKEAVEVFYDPNSEIRSLAYIESKNELIINNKQTTRLQESNKFVPIVYNAGENYGKEYVTPYASNGALVFDDDNLILTAAGNFVLYDNIDSIQIYHSDIIENDIRVLSGVKLGNDNYLLGTNSGLVRFKDKKIESIDNVPKELNVRINDIIQLNDTYLFATQGYGLICWNLEKKLRVIDTKKGLLSDNLEDLFLDSRNNLYVSSNSGLSKLWYNDSDSVMIKNYTSFHGLPSNEVNNVMEHNDAIYIATSNGIGILSGDNEKAPAQQIKIEECRANGELIIKNKKLAHLENNIEVSFKTLDYTMLSRIPYRYRLNENDWTQTLSTSTTFPALQPGAYRFLVQSQNFDGIWSESAIWDFKIGYPWWRTTTFHILAALGFFGLGYLIYKLRTTQLKNQLKVESEIRDLERSALQAQMNPHFIFNCLNSIQRFIMDNDKEQAMEYLATFAKLIRQSLNASNQSKITLAEEISMLHNYLDLEKLRYKNKFDYNIVVSDNITPEEITLPPLLVQPYVENAVIHGMKEKESGGMINIFFDKAVGNHLEITVADNGVASSATSTPAHKSLGMSITSKRLAYNNMITDKTLKIVPEYSDQGTSISILVKL